MMARQAGGDADDAGVEHTRQVEHTRILAVGGVGRCAEDGGKSGGHAVARQRTMQTWVRQIVLADGRADGQHVADVLHDGGKGNGHDGQDGGEHQRAVAVVEDRQYRVVALNRESHPGCFAKG